MIDAVPERRPALLYLCLENPWRLSAGGLIRNYWMIRALSERFEVELVTAGDPADPVSPDFAALCGPIHRFPARTTAARIAHALLPGSTLYTAGGVSHAMRSGVAALLARRPFAAIVLDLAMVDALPAGCSVPIVYNAHNCEATLLERRAAKERSVVRRLATAVDARRLRPIEARLIERAALVAACSADDVEDLARLAPSARRTAVVVPNGVDGERYAAVTQTAGVPGTVLVTGSFDWQPNRLGLRWFLREVMPLLAPQVDARHVRVRVAGRMNAALAAEIDAVPLVRAAPNVPDMRTELANAEIVVAPIVASSGTRLRILEAWAAGRPVVTTPEGAFGLPHADGDDLIVRSGAAPFAQAVAELLRDPGRRVILRRHGLARAGEHDWRRIGRTLMEACDRAGL